MSKYQKAINSISKVKLTFEGLFDLIPLLEDAGSVENHLNELKGQRELAQKEVDDLAKDLVLKKKAHADLKVKADKSENDAKTLAAKIVAEAEEQSKGLRNKIKKEIDLIEAKHTDNLKKFRKQIKDAEVKLQQVQMDHEVELGKLNQTKADLNSIKSSL